MTTRVPDVTLDLDTRNPGHFLACCGLLELAGRRWPESEGWFDDGQFHVVTRSGQTELLGKLLDALLRGSPLVTPTIDSARFEAKVAPLLLVSLDMRLDWWLGTGGTNPNVLKLWAGNQHPAGIIDGLQKACVAGLDDGSLRLVGPDQVGVLRWRSRLTGRFGFDPRPAWNALDLGFSPNDQGLPVLTAPVTELLGAIGLQGFRPQAAGSRTELIYSVWSRRLPLRVARAAASGAFSDRRFRFEVSSRGRYKSFTYAEPVED
ncbi:MAG: hypothetical protein KGJ98_01500 [Chloroflexota bacterium]|nr:hypothetical protein [Chloroflexota bacterium]